MEDAKLGTNNASRTLTRLVQRLTATLGQRRYEAWFASQTEFRVAAGGELQVMVGSPLERDYLQRQFADEVRQAYSEVTGEQSSVSFRIHDAESLKPLGEPSRDKTPKHETPQLASASEPAAQHIRVASTRVSRTIGPPATREHRPAPPTASQPTVSRLDQLVVGDANSDAVTTARQVADGVFPASPLVLWGATGVGKTQLLRAIHEQVRRSRRCRSVCLTAEQFLSGFVEAVHGRGLPSFRSKHRGVDLLLLDDVQMLLGKRKTLEELQYTLDALVASGSQVVLASDRGPAELTALGGELASRLAAGVAIEVRTPDVKMRRELLKRTAAERGVQLEADAVDAVANGLVGGARELSGVVNRLRYETGLFGDSVDEQLARRVVADINRQSTPRVKLSDVQEAVCRVFGVEASLLKSDKRTKAASEPRMLAMWLARKYTRSAWSEIGDFFGRRRHSTVISACRRVDKLLDSSAQVSLDGAACAVQEALRRVEAELRTA